MATILKPPAGLPATFDGPSVFLAGSIDMGQAIDWQQVVGEALERYPVTVLNPRRDAWDASWEQSADNPQFAGQVTWELEAQERADRIAMFLAPGTSAPITLLELGLFARSGRLLVCCPAGYWRKGNVDVVCARYGIPQVPTLEELCRSLTAWAGRQNVA